MGNNNDYLTLEESARVLGKPESYLKTLMSEGKLSAKLAGGRWWISVKDLEKLHRNLPPELEKVVHNFLGDTPVKKPPQPTPKAQFTSKARKPVNRPKERTKPIRTHNFVNEGSNLEELDARVTNILAQIEVRLAFVIGGKAVWNKLREDNYQLTKKRRAALPKRIVGLLVELQKTKQRYIVLRETGRYKRLLRSLPEWDLKRIAKAIEALQKKQGVVTPPKAKLVKGIEGYHGGSISKKRYYWNEED